MLIHEHATAGRRQHSEVRRRSATAATGCSPRSSVARFLESFFFFFFFFLHYEGNLRHVLASSCGRHTIYAGARVDIVEAASFLNIEYAARPARRLLPASEQWDADASSTTRRAPTSASAERAPGSADASAAAQGAAVSAAVASASAAANRASSSATGTSASAAASLATVPTPRTSASAASGRAALSASATS
eukprot:6011229-Prymnesium_polylepis.1